MRRALLIVCAVTAAHLLIAAVVPLSADEAYYWLWSKSLAPYYFDHPPGIAFAVRAGTALLGDTALGIRAVPALTALPTGLVAWALARGQSPRGATQVLLLALFSPLMWVGGSLATTDPLLVLFYVAAVLAALGAMERPRLWLLFGLLAAAALLCKITALFLLPLPFAAMAIKRRASGYAALALLLAVAPSLLSLLSHPPESLSPVTFQWRHGLSGSAFPGGTLSYVGGTLLALSPLTAIACALALPKLVRGASDGRKLLLVASALPWVTFLVTSLAHTPEMNWPAVAYLPLLATCAPAFGRMSRALYGVVLATAAALSVTFTLHAVRPFLPLAPTRDITARSAGWKELAETLSLKTTPSFPSAFGKPLFTDRYQSAALLTFYGAPAKSIEGGWRRNQWDIWGNAVTEPSVLVGGLTPDISARLGGAKRVATLMRRFRGVVVEKLPVYLIEPSRPR